MTCQNCGARVSADDKFCPICGVSTSEKFITEKSHPKFCTHCGGKLENGERYCPACGFSAEESIYDQPAERLRSSVPLRDRKFDNVAAGSAGKIFALILLLILAIAFLYGYRSHPWSL